MTKQPITDPRLDIAHQAANNRDFARAEQLLHDVLSQLPTEIHSVEPSERETCLLALDLLGFVLFFQGRPEEAEQACRRAIAVAPDRAYSNKGLGLCLAKQGKVDEGLPYLRRAIALQPEWLDPRWDMAIVLHEAQRFEEALAVLVEAECALPAERMRFVQLRQVVADAMGQRQA
jgi:tetratricopeptide (TPR) repeat protein